MDYTRSLIHITWIPYQNPIHMIQAIISLSQMRRVILRAMKETEIAGRHQDLNPSMQNPTPLPSALSRAEQCGYGRLRVHRSV